QGHAVHHFKAREARFGHAENGSPRAGAWDTARQADAIIAPRRPPEVLLGFLDQAGPVFDEADAPHAAHRLGRLCGTAPVRRRPRASAAAGIDLLAAPP